MNLCVKVGARGSNLSQKQVWEVLNELKSFYPAVSFEPVWMQTSGDKDLKTSLKFLENSNFFTKELDDKLASGEIRLSIHSAKDLPDPLKQGLCIVALTQGLDPADSLVTAKNFTGTGKIATSSIRREKTILDLYPKAQIVDIRGTIEQRLSYLERQEIEGLVVAECALIRLGLTALPRIRLPEPYATYQGQLAVLARSDDVEMQHLFSCIDSRKL